MYLHYHWENVEVNYECDYGGNTLSPHTRASVEDVDYDFWVDIQDEDVIEYLLPPSINKEEKQRTSEDYRKVIEFLHNKIDYDDLEDDEYFVEFLTEKYKEKAWEEFEESNSSY